jgi:hypothetical protein
MRGLVCLQVFTSPGYPNPFCGPFNVAPAFDFYMETGMKPLTRREAAGLAAAAIALPITSRASADETPEVKTPSPEASPRDKLLANALQNPQAFQLRLAGTINLVGDGHGRTMKITSAFDLNQEPTEIGVRSHSMRIFRAANLENGGYFDWRYHEQKGSFKIDMRSWSRTIGPIVMVMREGRDLARVYVMIPDLRC